MTKFPVKETLTITSESYRLLRIRNLNGYFYTAPIVSSRIPLSDHRAENIARIGRQVVVRELWPQSAKKEGQHFV